jgi:hypothetical protein
VKLGSSARRREGAESAEKIRKSGFLLGVGDQISLPAAAYWLTPSLLCLTVHWLCLQAWFRADDFAWLGLANTVHSFPDLLHALFAPQAQGTIRPWSERAFFMAGYVLFGLDSLPYRVLIFATQFADLILVAAIGTRLSGRRAVGFWAAIFWAVNSTATEPLGWACVYNEVMCGFFLLLAFYLFLRYIETGRTRWYAWQWVVFVLGFGALELNLVYPFLAAGYAWLCARKFLGRALAMAPVSLVYFFIHNAAAPPQTSGIYAMHYGFPMLHSLAAFWAWSVGPTYLETPYHWPKWLLRDAVYLITLALAIFLWRKLRARQYAALFPVVWYLVVIGPVTPLSDHLTEYYPFVPAIGLAWLGAWAFVEGWCAGLRWKMTAVALAAVYGVMVVPQTLAASQWNYNLTERDRNLLESLAGAAQQHPGKALMLYGVDEPLFWNAIRDRSYQLIGLSHLYLPPGSERLAAGNPGWSGVEDFAMAGESTAHALERDELEVYDVRGERLRNITPQFAAMPIERSLPRTVNAGDPLTAYLLGPEWYSLEVDHRWMPKRATLRMAGPNHAGQVLSLRGYCTEDQLRAGPVTLKVTANGSELPPGKISSSSWDLRLPLPDAVAGKPEMQVSIEVDRTAKPANDPRELGLAFGEIAVK